MATLTRLALNPSPAVTCCFEVTGGFFLMDSAVAYKRRKSRR
jgi:hypothetical protein